MKARSALIVERINDRLDAICKAVPPIKPPAAHWMCSDAGPSYCWRCACIARGMEFDLGAPLNIDAFSYRRDDWEQVFFDGIDGGFDTTSDSTAACEICRRTLSYILTDGGVEQEIDFFRKYPLESMRDEDSYALDRLALNIWEDSPRHIIFGVSVAVNQAYRLVKRLSG